MKVGEKEPGNEPWNYTTKAFRDSGVSVSSLVLTCLRSVSSSGYLPFSCLKISSDFDIGNRI